MSEPDGSNSFLQTGCYMFAILFSLYFFARSVVTVLSIALSVVDAILEWIFA